MNALQLKGNWNVIKGKLKQKIGTLTDDERRYVQGKEEELIGRLQKRTAQTHVHRATKECKCGAD